MNSRAALMSLAMLVLWTGCATVPYTNRHQFNLISGSEEDQMGAQAYADVKSKAKLSTDEAATQMVKRVGKRIAAVADKPDYHWEFILIDDPKTVNAFCLPGGRVAVYTGILPVTLDENGLAVVMSHEVSHALARHGAERMSEQMAVGLAEQAAVEGGLLKTQGSLDMVNMAYGVGLGLPHSRSQESEADHIGLILMAKAGYDPRTAVAFWKRMAKVGGGKPPEFLSTHPADSTRIERIQEQLPEALTYYKPR
jgi:metalloendopeptidase OMA1, mitochondrial